MMMIGSDTEQVRRLGGAMKQAASVLENIDQKISPAMRAGVWSGQDADVFYQSWVRALRPKLFAASQSLKAAAADLENQAAEQERASRGEGGSVGSGTSAALAAAMSPAWVVAPTTAGGAPGFASAAEARTALDRILAQPDSPQRAEQIRQWADRLGPNQRDFAEANALAVGNTNGMPLAMRDLANRELAEHYLKNLRDRGNLTEDEKARDALLTEILDKSSRHGKVAQLLVFDPAGDGRIAVSLGSVDSAKNIAVMVPGISNTMANFGSNMLDNAANLRNGNPDVAVVAWLGYDTPPGPYDPSRVADSPAILGEGRAMEGATALRGFVNDGLGLSDSDRVTVIGHSYGSIVAMRAAQDGGLSSADAIVVMGSPGSEAYNGIEDLNLNASQQFYSMSADLDPIAGGLVDTEAIGGAVVGGVRGAVAAESIHGFRRPQDFGFGGTRLETDQWGSASRDSSGHSEYYGQGTGSLLNLQAVTTGAAIEERDLQVEDLGSAVRGGVGEVGGYVSDFADAATTVFGDGAEWATDAFVHGVESAKETVGDGVDAVKETVGDGVDAVKETVGDGVDAVKGVAGDTVDGLSRLFGRD